jgi:hypothetical protein
MKEPSENTIPTIDVATKRKRRKRGTSLSTSKQRKRRELRKMDLKSIEGRRTSLDLSKPFGIEETGYLNPQLNLHVPNRGRKGVQWFMRTINGRDRALHQF